VTDDCPTCNDDPLVDLLTADINEMVRRVRELELKLHPGFVDDPNAEKVIIAAPKQSVIEAIAILEGVIDLMTVNGWVGLASELGDVRDLIQSGNTLSELQPL
jgi:hypothetical protein